MSTWSKEETLLLIDIWEENPCLYDKKNAMYTSKYARNEAISNIMEGLHPKVTTKEEIKSKMTILRSNYCHELTKIYKSKKNRVGTDNIYTYTPSVFWFEKLKYLEPHVNFRQNKNNNVPLCETDADNKNSQSNNNSISFFMDEDDSSNLNSYEDPVTEEPDMLPEPEPKKLKTDIEMDSLQVSKIRDHLNKNIQQSINQDANFSKCSALSYNTEVDSFGKLVMAKIDRIIKKDFNLGIEAQQKILQILYEIDKKLIKVQNVSE